jgi:hypothetical protein
MVRKHVYGVCVRLREEMVVVEERVPKATNNSLWCLYTHLNKVCAADA